MTRTLEEAVKELKREPAHPVRAVVEGLTVEVRVVPSVEENRSAADVFAAIGPWEGETTAEMIAFLSRARREGSQRNLPEL